MKLKIVHTESSCGWGGQELRVISDIVYANMHGHEALLLCDHKSQFEARGSLSNNYIICTSIGSKSFFCLFDTYRNLKSLKPDVVVTHSSTDSWLVGLIEAFTPLEYKIVRMRHVRTPVKPTIRTKWLYQRANVIVTTSKDIREHLIDTLHLMPIKVLSIPTGFHLPPEMAESGRINKRKTATSRENTVLGMVSTLRSWKGHEIALRAIREFPNVKLVIVGDGPQAEKIKNLVCSFGLNNRVELVGYQKNPLFWIASFDGLLQPSLHGEGVSQTVLQAMGLGIPVIASDISGLREVVIEDETGYLCDPDNVRSLHDAIERFLKNPEARDKLTEGAKNLVNKHYAYASLSKKFLDALESL